MDSSSLSFWDRLFREMSQSVWEDWLVKLLAAIIATLLATFTLWLARRLWPKFKYLWDGKRRLERGLAAVAPDSKGIWLADSFRPTPPRDYQNKIRVSKPIIVVANLKGGVGKTTIASNLIAHYANKKSEKVLGIDLDFQGSLSANSLSRHDRDQLLVEQTDGGLSKAARLIDDRDAPWLRDAPNQIQNVATGKLIPAYYSLAAMENRVMIEWLLGQRTQDVRYHLADILHDPIIQNSYDRIIIDAPPRLTTGSVQALCAATHVLIPTILDDLSAEAVGAFADQLRIHQELWPYLRIVGAVGTMIAQAPTVDGVLRDTPLNDVEVDALAAGRNALQAALETARPPLRDTSFLPLECFIPDKRELSRAAGHGIAYASPSRDAVFRAIRESFDFLGDEINRRL